MRGKRAGNNSPVKSSARLRHDFWLFWSESISLSRERKHKYLHGAAPPPPGWTGASTLALWKKNTAACLEWVLNSWRFNRVHARFGTGRWIPFQAAHKGKEEESRKQPVLCRDVFGRKCISLIMFVCERLQVELKSIGGATHNCCYPQSGKCRSCL